MKRHFFYLMFSCVFWMNSNAQKTNENYYSLFHETINDSEKTVLRFGHYVSAGIGPAHPYNDIGAGAIISYSLAYKSHLVSFSYGSSSMTVNSFSLLDGRHKLMEYNTNYCALLIGESFRYRFFFVSLSAGIAQTKYEVIDYANYEYYSSKKNGVNSFPVEFKIFWLAPNIAGIGFHFSSDFIQPSKFNSYYLGGCLVFGYWNKLHKKLTHS